MSVVGLLGVCCMSVACLSLFVDRVCSCVLFVVRCFWCSLLVCVSFLWRLLFVVCGLCVVVVALLLFVNCLLLVSLLFVAFVLLGVARCFVFVVYCLR